MTQDRLLSAACLLVASIAHAQTYMVQSPNVRVHVSVTNDAKSLNYSVTLDGNKIIGDSALGLIINDLPLGNNELDFVGKTQGKVKRLI